MNNVILMGRLARDVDSRRSGETTIGRFTIAVDRPRGRQQAEGQPTADFISCVAFGKTAETIAQYCTKGSQVLVQGHIQTGSYTNQQGAKVYTTDVIVDRFEFCGSRNNSGNGGQPAPAAPAAPAMDATGFMDIPDGIDEELPFT